MTQLYVADEPLNQGDMIFRSLSTEQRKRVVADFTPVNSSEIAFAACFDIVLVGGHGATRT